MMRRYSRHCTWIAAVSAGWVLSGGLLGCELDPPVPTEVEPRIDKAKAAKVSGVPAAGLVPAGVTKVPLKKPLIPIMSEPEGFFPAYIGDSRNGLLSFDGNNFKRLALLPSISALASDGSGRLWVAAKQSVYTYDPKTDTTAKLFSAGMKINRLAADGKGGVFVVGPMHIGRYADGSYKRLSKLPRPSLSCYFAFVETGGDLITDASFDDYRYRVKSNTWEMLSLPSRAKLQSLVPLSGGRMWARAWLRGFRHAYLLGTNQVWQDLGKLKGVILHRAPGSAKTVHLGSSTEVTVVNVDTKSTRRWKVARYVSQVLALDADRSGRTWVAGTDGLAIVPAPGAATKVRSASTRNLSAWAGLPGHGPLTAVHVPGKGPEIISIPF